ncbi:MAG TPA: peptidoglycan-binding protein [Polyangiaceae bacterium]|nr:peptidoglycan-binding protein [Polyangiaceae bacterium]
MVDSEVEVHPEATFAVAVAPGDPADDSVFNSLRPGILSIACFRLNDPHFDFDSSFILPATREALVQLGEMRADYADSPASIFGHADPVGTDTYNKTLSGNRARAFHALLTRDVQAWEALYNDHSWGLKSTQRILKFLRDEAAAKEASEASADDATAPSDTDPDASGDADPDTSGDADPTDFEVDGKNTKEWKAAVKKFQGDESLHVDGDAGPETRKRLYELYMAALCVDLAGNEFKFEPSDFLGKGKDKKGKAAFQGCSEFNPILLLSKSDDDTLEKEERNSMNAPNRRVVLYFFPPGLEIDVDKWPCPRASEGSAGCKKRFWSDHERRRKQDPELRRSYARQPALELEGTRDTFACRFYDRLARHSPCEAGFEEWLVQLILPEPADKPLAEHKRAAGATFKATFASGDKPAEGEADANGLIRIRARRETDQVTVELKVPLEDDGSAPNEASGSNDSAGAGDEQTSASTEKRRFATVRLTLQGGGLKELHDEENADAARKDRLLNLGFGPTARANWDKDPKVLQKAQDDAAKQEGGAVDDDKLRQLYGS